MTKATTKQAAWQAAMKAVAMVLPGFRAPWQGNVGHVAAVAPEHGDILAAAAFDAQRAISDENAPRTSVRALLALRRACDPQVLTGDVERFHERLDRAIDLYRAC